MMPLVAAIILGKGRSLPTVTISDQTKIASNPSGQCSAGIKIERGGKYYAGTNNSTLNPTYADVGGNEWSSEESATVGDDFECRLDTSTGSLTVGTADTWLAMTSDREFKVYASNPSSAAFTGTLRIREVGSSVDLDTAAIQLSAIAI